MEELSQQPRPRIALFGGTFNPPTRAHERVGEIVSEQLGLERLLWLPNRTPAHKQLAPGPGAQARLGMRQALARSHPRWQVLDWEIASIEPSVTVTALTRLAAEYPEAERSFVCGTDAALDLPLWYQPEQIVELAQIVVVARPGYGKDAKDDWVRLREQLPGLRLSVLEEPVPMQELSSTDVRAALLRGDDESGSDAVASGRQVDPRSRLVRAQLVKHCATLRATPYGRGVCTRARRQRSVLRVVGAHSGLVFAFGSNTGNLIALAAAFIALVFLVLCTRYKSENKQSTPDFPSPSLPSAAPPANLSPPTPSAVSIGSAPNVATSLPTSSSLTTAPPNSPDVFAPDREATRLRRASDPPKYYRPAPPPPKGDGITKLRFHFVGAGVVLLWLGVRQQRPRMLVTGFTTLLLGQQGFRRREQEPARVKYELPRYGL